MTPAEEILLLAWAQKYVTLSTSPARGETIKWRLANLTKAALVYLTPHEWLELLEKTLEERTQQ